MDTSSNFWADFKGWTTHPLYGDIDPIDILLTAVLVAIGVFVIWDINTILKGKVV